MSAAELASVIECYKTMFEITSDSLHPEVPSREKDGGDCRRASDGPGTMNVPIVSSTASDSIRELLPDRGSKSGIPSSNIYSPSNSNPYGSRWARSMYEQLKPRLSTSGPKNQRKELPVIIGGEKIVACYDSCAGEKQDKGSFTVGNGKVVQSIGKVMAVCTFARDPSFSAMCSFHVFNKLAAPIILGFPFLEDSKTLTTNRHRLQERSSHTKTYPVVNCINSPQQEGLQFICHIDDRETMMSADTASDLDLMSPSYVEKYKYKLMGRGRSVRLADTSITQTIGKALVTLVLADGRSFLKFFDVLPGLRSDMLLGEASLESMEAFTRLKDSFIKVPIGTENPDFNILLDLGVAKKAIARCLRRPVGTAQCPDTPSLAKQKNDALHAELLRQDAVEAQNVKTEEGNASNEAASVHELE